MLPIASSVPSFTPAPQTLVATPLPGTIDALRPPFDSVPPSFSSPVVGNDARGNGQSYAPAEPTPDVVPEDVDVARLPVRLSSPAAPPAVSPTFLAQLIGQLPPPLQGTLNGVLVGYEKIVLNSLTKYGNSYALIPRAAASSSAYEQALRAERVAREARAEASQPEVQTATPVREAAQTEAAPVKPVQEIVLPQAPREIATPREAIPAPRKSAVSPAKVAIAYLRSDANVELLASAALKASA